MTSTPGRAEGAPSPPTTNPIRRGSLRRTSAICVVMPAPREARETLTATALVESGADMVVLRHPESVTRVKAAIAELVTA